MSLRLGASGWEAAEMISHKTHFQTAVQPDDKIGLAL